MSTVHDRWELVEPLLFAQALRDPSAFRSGATKRSQTKDLAALEREHRLESSAIARALDVLAEHAPSPLDGEEPIHALISRAANRCLVLRGDHWALRIETRRPGHEIIRWRGVTMLLPPSIITAGALALTNLVAPCRVQTLPDSLAPREPVGHLHVHLGPLLPFEALWVNLWRAFLKRGTLDAPGGSGIASIKAEDLPEIGRYAGKRQPGLRWQWILELAFTARVWLMLEAPKDPLPAVIRDFSRGTVDPGQRARVLLTLWAEGAWRERARLEARQALEARLQRERWFARKRLLAATTQAGASEVDTFPNEADEEVRFLARCLRRSADDETYARVFYQYLRVKVALHGQLVVDPWTMGLRHFLDVVQRDGPYVKVIDDGVLLDAARLDAARMERPLRVECLEIHTAPTSWLKQARRDATARHTWILSFVRAPTKKEDPDGTRASKRWRAMAARASTICRLLARRMETHPGVLRELRGLSLMDWERNGPVWLFEAPFRRLIEASAEVAAAHPRLRLRPIQTALHLGEDFDHLLSGLRQIFEPFEWGLINRGDRIGHALALGRAPKTWCEENPWVRMRPWDRILDIGFVYWAFDSLGLPLDAGSLERMRLNARDAIRDIFGEQGRDPLETALDLWLSLPRAPPARTDRNQGRSERLRGARGLRERMENEERVGRKAMSLSLAVETKLELSVIEAVHAAVFDRVAKMQVAIEVNPSSNLLIGGFRSIFEQPVFHTDDLPILLNADDPLTFSTTLADDYAYAWAGMVVGMGHSPTDATRRLEEAARCSMRYAFTETHERDPQAVAGALATRDDESRRRGS